MFCCDFEDCSASFRKKWKLVEHVAKHTGEKPFACTHEGCSKRYTRQPHLQRHLRTHTNLKDFLCEEEGCGGAFSSRDNLKKHILRVHQGRHFKCDHAGCGKTFHKHQHLTVHQYVHTNIKPFKCEQNGCEARFLIPSKLKAHMKIHKGYPCTKDGCEAFFTKWSELTAHMSAHTLDFHCENCDKVFNKKKKLHSHMKVHEEERVVFICPREECERRFMKIESMRLHISKFHDGDRPFSCEHSGCNKTFSYKKSLTKHQVVHEPGYQKPPAKPKKRRTPASRLSGHVDIGDLDIVGSPPDSLTFEPIGEKEPDIDNHESVAKQTLVTGVSMMSSSGTLDCGGDSNLRHEAEPLTRKTDTPSEVEVDLSDTAERMLLAMQNTDIQVSPVSTSLRDHAEESTCQHHSKEDNRMDLVEEGVVNKQDVCEGIHQEAMDMERTSYALASSKSIVVTR